MKSIKNGLGLVSALTLVGALAATAGLAEAQPTNGAAPAFRPSGNPSRDTLTKMQRPVTLELNETRFEDVMNKVAEISQAHLEVMYKSDKEGGFDKDALVTMSVKDMPALAFLEKVLHKISAESGEDSTWQLSELGTLQVGTKERLNKFKRIEIYDINDLLFVMPVYTNAPEIDLQQVLQNSGGGKGKGGGSGQSPFKDNQNKNRGNDQEKTKEDRAKDVIALITKFVEQPQWTDNGGEGGQIQYYQGHIIVEGPDYMQRGVNGYPWWPQIRTGVAGGKRYVSLNLDTSVSKVDALNPFPIQGAVGGGGGGGGGPGPGPGR